jgi:membrane protease YdiL (CAAX protease family)
MKKVKTIVCALFLVVGTMLIPWGAMYPLSKYMNSYLYTSLKYFVTFVLSFLVLFILRKKNLASCWINLFHPKEKKQSFFKDLFTFGLLGLIGSIMPLLFSYDTIDLTPSLTTILSFFLSILMIALSEELLFRIVILGLFLQEEITSKKQLLLAICLASIVFGLRHLINLVTMPNTVFSTFCQVGFTFLAGTYLCAVYLRTNRIGVVLLIHFLEDVSSGFWCLFSTKAQLSSTADTNLWQIAGLLVIQIIYFVFCYFMIKDKKYTYGGKINETRTDSNI